MQHNWEVTDLYENMIYKYEDMIGGTTRFGVTITEEFINTLKKRLVQLKGTSLWVL